MIIAGLPRQWIFERDFRSKIHKKTSLGEGFFSFRNTPVSRYIQVYLLTSASVSHKTFLFFAAWIQDNRWFAPPVEF